MEESGTEPEEGSARALRRSYQVIRLSDACWSRGNLSFPIDDHGEVVEEGNAPVDNADAGENEGDTREVVEADSAKSDAVDSEDGDTNFLPVPPTSTGVLKLQIPTEIRWNSTWYMLERFLMLRIPMVKFLEEKVKEKDYRLPVLLPEQWSILYWVYQILQPYKTVTKVLEGDTSITCSWVLPAMARIPRQLKSIHRYLTHRKKHPELCKWINRLCHTMTKEMDDPNYLEAAGIMLHLDPTKEPVDSVNITGYIWGDDDEDYFPKVKRAYNTVRQLQKVVYRECWNLLKKIQARKDGSIQPEVHAQVEGNKKKPVVSHAWLFDRNHVTHNSGWDPLKGEWKEYCENRARNRTGPEETPETWWAVNQKRFPTVSVLAAEYLCIPASSSGIERLFSKNGHQLNRYRQAMQTERVEDLTLVRDNMDMFPDNMD